MRRTFAGASILVVEDDPDIRDLLSTLLEMAGYNTTACATAEQGLNALVVRPENEPKWGGQYLRKAVPADPWGNAYVYRTPGEQGAENDLLSYGKDGPKGDPGPAAQRYPHLDGRPALRQA